MMRVHIIMHHLDLHKIKTVERSTETLVAFMDSYADFGSMSGAKIL